MVGSEGRWAMSIRVRLRDGAIVPVDPLPPEWGDGRVLQLGDAVDESTPVHENGVAGNGQEVSDDDVEWLTDEEYERFKANIEEADREAKAWVRKEAALCRHMDLTLLSTDRDFDALPDLRREGWVTGS
jgi:hypothetical protein